MKTDTATLIAALRILARDIYCEDGVATATIAEAANRLEELRLTVCRIADQDATLSVCDGNVTVTMDHTLTDAEREAVKRAANFSEGAAGYCKDQANVKAAMDHAAALRGLLERLG